jgi:hypothetical protein
MSLEALQKIRQDREDLSKAIHRYRERFDNSPDFGAGFFPKSHLMSFYIDEIIKALKTGKPIVSKEKDLNYDID